MTAYATLAELKAYAGISLTDTAQEALLNSLLERASEVCRTFTGQEFAAAETTVAIDFSDPRVEMDGATLTLYSMSALSVTSIGLEDGTVIPGASVALLPRSAARKYKIRLLDPYGWTGTFVEITGKFGYSLTPPADIVHSVIRLAHFMFKQKDNASGDTDRPIVSPEGLLLMPGGLPTDVQAIWQKYRRVL